MVLIIDTPKSDADFLRMAEIRGLAFGSQHEYICLLFPRFTTAEGQTLLRDRLLRMQRDLSSVRFVLVRDTDSGEIVSQAEWHSYDADAKGDVMQLDFLEGTDEEREYGRYLIDTFQARRREAIAATTVPLMLLDSLATDPKYQRRGAASMLVQWGLDKADEIGGEAYLEATDVGKQVYEKLGFVALEQYSIPLPPKWADKAKTQVYLMRRPVAGHTPVWAIEVGGLSRKTFFIQ